MNGLICATLDVVETRMKRRGCEPIVSLDAEGVAHKVRTTLHPPSHSLHFIHECGWTEPAPDWLEDEGWAVLAYAVEHFNGRNTERKRGRVPLAA